MSTIKANQHQVGSNVTANKNIVLTTDASTGDLVINKGVFDGTLTEVSRILNAGGGQEFTQTGTGAVARSVASKLQESVSVKDFGAVGDGVTDDTAAIQAALTYAAASKAEIHIPAGIYYVTSALVFTGSTTGPLVEYSDLVINGAGVNSTIIKTSVSGSALLVKSGKATLSNFTMQCSGGTTPVAIQLGSNADSLIVSQSTMADVKIYGYYKGLYLNAIYDSAFYRVAVLFSQTGGTALDITSVTGDNSNHCNFYTCQFEGLQSGTLFKSTGTNTASGYNHMINFDSCHFETYYYSTRLVDIQYGSLVNFKTCIFNQNSIFGESISARVSAIRFDAVYNSKFLGGAIAILGSGSTASKLIEVVSASSAQFFGTYFSDVSNVPGGNEISGLISGTYLDRIAFESVRINDFNNAALNSGKSIVGDTNVRFKNESASNQLRTYFNSATTDNTAWSTTPISVMGLYGSQSRGPVVTIVNGSYADYTIENAVMLNGAAVIAVMANANAPTAGLFFKRGTNCYAMAALANFVVSATPAAGSLGIQATGNNSIRIYNNFGSDQQVSIFVMGAQ